MIQEIITLVIVGSAVGYAIYSIVKKLKKGNKTNCSDCSCCVKKCSNKQPINFLNH